MPPTNAESRRVGEPAHDLVATRPGDSQITVKGGRCDLTDVVKTNTFVTDFDEFQKCGDVRMRYFGVATPTSTTVGVTRLAGPDFMIEIEAVAVVNS
jgi:enamine deaminase RidA (YjgF/YER057c/UK114 family)